MTLKRDRHLQKGAVDVGDSEVNFGLGPIILSLINDTPKSHDLSCDKEILK